MKFLSVALITLLAAASASAQEVRGTVVGGATREPLRGAMVVLLNARDSAVVTALSASSGAFRLRAPAAGRYRLRIEHIGFENSFSEPFDVSDGGVTQVDVEAATKAVELVGLVVTGARRNCEARPSQGVAAVVWEEARKALSAAAWTAGRDVYRILWTKYEREIASGGRRITREERHVSEAPTLQPFVSPNLATLMRQGFVHAEGGDNVFSAPDANVLLSDEFLDTHCFSVERRVDEGVAMLGLRFDPLRDREVPEVSGVMWLEESNARLRRVEFDYQNLGRRIDTRDAFGELTFRNLPNGTWLIEEWRIRIPVLVEGSRVNRATPEYRVLRYNESGGLVHRVTTTEGEVIAEGTAGRMISGLVVDSAGAPAPGVQVFVEGVPLVATSDAAGAFQIPGLGEGEWRVTASSPVLERLGHPGITTDVDIGRSDARDVKIQMPSVTAAATRICAASDDRAHFWEGSSHEATRSILAVRVVDRNGIPAARANLSIRWAQYSGGGGLLSLANEVRVSRVDDQGVFLLCNVPATARPKFQLRASDATHTSPIVEAPFSTGREVHLAEVRLTESLATATAAVQGEAARAAAGTGSAAGAVGPAGASTAAGTDVPLQVRGTLTDIATGRPVSAASIELLSEDGKSVRARTISSATGSFRLIAPSEGTFRVRAWRLALDTIVYGPVQVVRGAPANLELSTSARVVEVPGIDVEVAARTRALADEGFYDRQRTGAGVYITPQRIEALKPVQTREVFQAVPGVRLQEQGAGPPTLMTIAGIQFEQRNPPKLNPRAASFNDTHTCLPVIYVDGVTVQAGGDDPDGFRQYDLGSLPASSLLAVEIFRGPAEVPPRFAGPNSPCGVIVIWTKAAAGRLATPPRP
jgi:hypothetical protein